MKNNMHYNGFVDTCAKYGIEKSAADALYKEAFWGAVGKAFQFVPKLFGAVKAAPRALRAIPGALKNAKQIRAFQSSIGNNMSRTKAFMLGMKGRMGELAATKGPGMMQRWGNFSAKHPMLGMAAVAAPAVYMTNAANGNSEANSPEAKQMAVNTPAEQMMMNRFNSGYGLPGLGLDFNNFT